MRPFAYQRAGDLAEAARVAADAGGSLPPTSAPVQYLAGGTTILDLMKLDVMRPMRLIDIRTIDGPANRIERRTDGLHLGGLVTMAEAAQDGDVKRDYPIIAQSLALAASPQIRNMATLAGNILQRTRCSYFRDSSWPACNKRLPGSGCAAIGGVNRKHAVLGVSEHCIAAYPGDLAQSLVALDAVAELHSPQGVRVVPVEALHRLPGNSPHIETILAPGEIVAVFIVPAARWTRRSLFLKIRDRQSYEFALASAAVALDLAEGNVREARIALGGVASRPWRAREAEAALAGQPLDEKSARLAATMAFAAAETHGGNDYKRRLGERTLVRALLQTANMSI